jgi:hypothetical protein
VRAHARLKKGVGVPWPRIPATCASARALVHGGRGEGEADRGGPRRRERERTGAQGNGSATGEPGLRGRERRGECGRRNQRRQLGPTRQRARGRGECGAVWRRQAGYACQGRQARAVGAWWASLGRNGFFYFHGISNCFSISFSLGFSIQIKFKFQIQTNSNMCNNSKNI